MCKVINSKEIKNDDKNYKIFISLNGDCIENNCNTLKK